MEPPRLKTFGLTHGLCLRRRKIVLFSRVVGVVPNKYFTKSEYLERLSPSNNPFHPWNKSLRTQGSFLFIIILFSRKNLSYIFLATGRSIIGVQLGSLYLGFVELAPNQISSIQNSSNYTNQIRSVPKPNKFGLVRFDFRFAFFQSLRLTVTIFPITYVDIT